jgi:hypothetical protein
VKDTKREDKPRSDADRDRKHEGAPSTGRNQLANVDRDASLKDGDNSSRLAVRGEWKNRWLKLAIDAAGLPALIVCVLMALGFSLVVLDPQHNPAHFMFTLFLAGITGGLLMHVMDIGHIKDLRKAKEDYRLELERATAVKSQLELLVLNNRLSSFSSPMPPRPPLMPNIALPSQSAPSTLPPPFLSTEPPPTPHSESLIRETPPPEPPPREAPSRHSSEKKPTKKRT